MNLDQFKLRLETQLYEAGEGKKVWEALSDTFQRDSVSELLKTFGKIMVNAMARKGFL